jgi:hypothetical protein
LTGDRARERSAENRSDAPIHLIKRSQELKAGKYALFTFSLSPFIFFVAKKEKTGKEKEKGRRFTPRATHDIERKKRSIREEKYERKRFK